MKNRKPIYWSELTFCTVNPVNKGGTEAKKPKIKTYPHMNVFLNSEDANELLEDHVLMRRVKKVIGSAKYTEIRITDVKILSQHGYTNY